MGIDNEDDSATSMRMMTCQAYVTHVACVTRSLSTDHLRITTTVTTPILTDTQELAFYFSCAK